MSTPTSGENMERANEKLNLVDSNWKKKKTNNFSTRFSKGCFIKPPFNPLCSVDGEKNHEIESV